MHRSTAKRQRHRCLVEMLPAALTHNIDEVAWVSIDCVQTTAVCALGNCRLRDGCLNVRGKKGSNLR